MSTRAVLIQCKLTPVGPPNKGLLDYCVEMDAAKHEFLLIAGFIAILSCAHLLRMRCFLKKYLGFTMSTTAYSPEELLVKYRKIRMEVGSREFFTRPKHQKTQEIWCAAHFGRHYEHAIGPCSILIEDHDEQTEVDFTLEVAGGVHPFQITEVQAPDRRRGDEYKRDLSFKATSKGWNSGTLHGSQWIREGIEKKLRRYGGRVAHLNLLVYLNFLAEDQQYVDIRDSCVDVASPFASVWLLIGNAAACIWSQTALSGPAGWIFGPESLASNDL